MKFLLTNDDGIDAPGLAALERAARQLGETVVVAPRELLSGCSHQTTTNRPLNVSQHGANRFSMDGTPADCTRIGLLHLAEDVDWVLSGVNDGGNLGIDLFMSGTVAGAREATALGRRAIAFSHYRQREHTIDWERAAEVTARVLHQLVSRPHNPNAFWNVNFPSVLASIDVVDCDPDTNPLPIRYDTAGGRYHYSGNYHGRKRNPGSDVDVCFSGKISVSRIRFGIA